MTSAIEVTDAHVQAANYAISYESQSLSRLKTPDTPENFAAVWRDISEAVVPAAIPFRRPVSWPQTDRPRVGFFVPNASMLAHTVNLRTLISQLESGDSPIEPYVYTLGARDAEFDAAFPGARYCGGATPVDVMLDVRQRSISDQITAMVFVSAPQCMPFLTTIGVAPVHIWWAHKWHGLELPDLHGYLDACHPYRSGVTIRGRAWTCTYTALPELFDPALSAQASALRRGMNADIVFGSLCRTEKLSEPYADAVGEILSRVPNSGYLYAGRTSAAWFEDRLARFRGRVGCIGWVNTRLWSQVFDVYLDTFPFQSGHTAFEVMSAGRAAVWLHDNGYGEEQGVTGVFEDTRPNHDVRWSYSAAEYIERAVTLATDPAARAQAGSANRRWIDDFMRDEPRMAASVSRAILDVIGSRRSS